MKRWEREQWGGRSWQKWGCNQMIMLFFFFTFLQHRLGDATAAATAAAAKSLQSTLCNPIDGSPPGSPIPGILQARTLEWVAISFSNAWKWKEKGKSLSCVRLFTTPWTAAYQALPSMGFSRQEYWSGVPLPSPPALLGGILTTGPTEESSRMVSRFIHTVVCLGTSFLFMTQ